MWLLAICDYGICERGVKALEHEGAHFNVSTHIDSYLVGLALISFCTGVLISFTVSLHERCKIIQ